MASPELILGNTLQNVFGGLFSNQKLYNFPLDLASDRIQTFTLFTIYQFVKAGPEQKLLRKPVLKIGLPIPANLANSQSFSYEDDSQNIVEDTAMKAMQGRFGDSAFFGEGKGEAIGAKVIGSSLGDAEKFARSSGSPFNPRLKSNFSGMGFKTHQFSWRMLAKSQDESTMISNIIAAFAYHASPSEEEFFIRKPDTFRVEFFPKNARSYLYSIGDCNVVDFTVTYNGGGIPVFFKDTKAPVEIDFSVTLKETTLAYRNRLKSQHEAMGVYSGTTEDTVLKTFDIG